MDPDRQLAALYRLLADAALGGHARVDALVALAQRTVWIVPWPDASAGWRTLVNSDGKAALPIFTGRNELETAAARFGWLGPDRKALAAEVGSREALRYARDKSLAFVVVDIAADHTLEITREEIEPLLTPAARRDTGPFAGTGRVSSTLMRAVVQGSSQTPAPMPQQSRSLAIRPTPAPGTLKAAVPTPGLQKGVLPVTPPPPGGGSSPGTLSSPRAATPSGAPSPVLPSMRLSPLPVAPDDAFLDTLETVLRDYPEVEWACLGIAGGTTAIGIRIDARMRSRLDSLAAALGSVSAGAPIVTLDDAQHLKAARGEALMFFPWRRR